MSPIRPQPLISVADVDLASRWYQAILGAESGHGGPEYEQILVDGAMVLQLHLGDAPHHHGTIGDRDFPTGNGVAIWFAVQDFDGIVERIRVADPVLVADVAVNPNSGNREIWIRDLDGYLVVFAEHDKV